jgi:hypothetical protein
MATAAHIDVDSLGCSSIAPNDDLETAFASSKPQQPLFDLVYAGIRRKLRTEGSPHMKALLRLLVWFLVARPSSSVCWSYYDCFRVSYSFKVSYWS